MQEKRENGIDDVTDRGQQGEKERKKGKDSGKDREVGKERKAKGETM